MCSDDYACGDSLILPLPPDIGLEVLEEKVSEGFFFKSKESTSIFHYPDGSASEKTTIGSVIRHRHDCVVILAHFPLGEETGLFLRSAIRPPLAFRDYKESGVREGQGIHNAWELPAGLVDEDEVGLDGLRKAAARELLEEVGMDVHPNFFTFLGKRTFSCPGQVAERLFFLEVTVDPKAVGVPCEDGSPFEKGGEVIMVKLSDALKAVKAGEIIDAKTEIGLRRLAERLSGV